MASFDKVERKKLPWWEPVFGAEEKDLLEQVIDSTFLNDGRIVKRLETELADMLECAYVIAVTSGTAAIYLSLKALGIGINDEVIVPDMTYIATANAVSMTGARVKLVDVSPESLCIDVNRIKEAVTSRTKAIIPVHVSGRGANMKKIMAIAEEKNLVIIEDAAEALKSRHEGKYLGTWGHTGCFSLSPFKAITSGQGGFITTNSDTLHQKLKKLKNQGLLGTATGGADFHEEIGFNFKYTDLQAAVSLGQLHDLERRLKRMRQIYELYHQRLKGCQHVRLPACQAQEVQLWTDMLVEDRKGLVQFLGEQGIDCRPFWYPIHDEPPYQVDRANQHFPISSRIAYQALWLPSAFTLDDDDVNRVCDAVYSFFSN